MKSVHIDEQGRLHFHGNLTGYFDEGGSAVVDERYIGSELNWYLLLRGKKIRWDYGVAEKLEAEDSELRNTLSSKVRIYQLRSGTDNRLWFASYDTAIQIAGNFTPDRYQLVYEGTFSNTDLDDICDSISISPPIGYVGRPIGVSDIIGVDDRYYYVDKIGYRPIFFH